MREHLIRYLLGELDADERRDLQSRLKSSPELRAELVGLGLSDADAREAIELIDKDQLIKDGEPDEKAISTVAKRLVFPMNFGNGDSR